MKNTVLLSIVMAFAAATSQAIDFGFNAGLSSGFASSDGNSLATGSLLRFGAFTISDADVAAHANDLAYLNANFVQVAASYIGHGNPAGGSGESDPINAGLFNCTQSAVDTTASGLDIAGLQIVYWAFNAADFASATEHGIFTTSAAAWTIIGGTGDGLDFLSLYTDIADLTVTKTGLMLDPFTKVLVGSFGPSVQALGGGLNFTLAEIPEPAAVAALMGGGVLLVGIWRRRGNGGAGRGEQRRFV